MKHHVDEHLRTPLLPQLDYVQCIVHEQATISVCPLCMATCMSRELKMHIATAHSFSDCVWGGIDITDRVPHLLRRAHLYGLNDFPTNTVGMVKLCIAYMNHR